MSEEPTPTPEPTEPAPIPSNTSEQVEMPPVATEAHTEAESAVPVNNPSDAEAMAGKDISEIEPAEAPPKQTAQIENPSVNKAVSVTPEPTMAQTVVNEPFAKLTLLAKAREMIQLRKRRKLEKIMGMFLKQASITNDEVEKLLHVSDATATRYLEQLEKEGKIKQSGKTGKGVSYSRI